MEKNVNKDQNQEAPEANGQGIKRDFKGLLEGIKVFMSDLLDIRQNTDQDYQRIHCCGYSF